MSKQAKKGLVPDLRFPNYRKSGEWSAQPLRKACQMKAGTFVQAAEIFDKEAEGLYPCYGGNGLRGFTRSYTHEGTYPLIGRQGAHCGNVVWAEGRFHATEHAVVAAANEGVNTRWLYHVLDHAHLNQYATGQAQPGLSVEGLEKVEIPFTDDQDEQEKIAACLSSLDALLAAERAKLEALREHKKGLMQQLFPAEGAKVPARRFPGFGGEWMEKTMSDLADITTGNKDTQNKVADGSYPFFVRSKTIERINSFSYDGEAILTAGDGVGVGKVFHYINGKFDFHQRVYCIYNFKQGVSGKFVFHFFSEHFDQRVMRMTAKNSVDSVRMPMIAEMPVAIPKDPSEQDAVATCLSSLDERISLQVERVALLEDHKKGLMQGLFPPVN
ncbi:MAG: restriction endonuclease subunit S [Bacteroidetes bacterium]|nr:restriction endonuclease subunit S [Bacteroidota bacterium]